MIQLLVIAVLSHKGPHGGPHGKPHGPGGPKCCLKMIDNCLVDETCKPEFKTCRDLCFTTQITFKGMRTCQMNCLKEKHPIGVDIFNCFNKWQQKKNQMDWMNRPHRQDYPIEPKDLPINNLMPALPSDLKNCTVEKCPNEWAKCQADKHCVSVLQNCEKKCNNKQTCWELCLSNANNAPATAVAKCAVKNSCLNQQPVVNTLPALPSDLKNCTIQKCPNEWAKCLDDKNCQPVLQNCERKCDNKQACWELCITSADNAAATAVAKCGLKNGCLKDLIDQASNLPIMPADLKNCTIEKCPNQWAACQADKNCQAVLKSCEKKCTNKQTCWELCLSNANNAPATAVAKCGLKNGCLKLTNQNSVNLRTNLEIFP